MAVISVDAALCTGCGLCESTCPEVFKVGDDNIAHVIDSDCSDHDANEVAAECPIGAIMVSD